MVVSEKADAGYSFIAIFQNHTSTAWRVGAYIGASIPLLFESFAIGNKFAQSRAKLTICANV